MLRALAGLLLGLLLGGPTQAQGDSAEREAEAAYQNAQSALSAHAWAEAEIHFERVLMFNPEHAPARIELAMLLAQRGKIETASAFVESLIDDPRTPPAHRQRLSELLAQLRRGAPVPEVIASEARQSIPAAAQPIIQARISLGYSANPYARADISNLTLTLPEGSTDLPVNQNIHAAPMLMSSLSYLAPNLCGFEAQDQRWGASEQNFANKLLVFCYGTVAGQQIQTFASTLRAVDGNSRSSAGLSVPLANWRLTAQLFKEPQLDRQGYTLRLDHLQRSQTGTQTLLFAEMEKSAVGVPGYAKSGIFGEYALTSGLSVLAQLSLQRDFAGYSAFLEGGATRRLLLAQLGLQKDWGQFGDWKLASALHLARRRSNLALFEYRDTTLQVSLERQL